MLADFFGFLTPTIQGGISSFPPTIIFHNKNDKIVPIRHSEKLDKLLLSIKIEHQFVKYDEKRQEVNHAFESNATPDIDSRSKTADWFTKHLPPTGN